LRVALISHGHPELSVGGTERASYALFRHLKGRHDITPVYIARANSLGHSGPFGAFRGRRDEILWSPPGMNQFRLVSNSPDTLREQASQLCASVAPDVVHVHHYYGMGTDLLRILRHDAGVPVVLTFHEYWPICNQNGQMVKTDTRLCYAASPAECSACFPNYSAGKFFLRKELILDHLSCVSIFIAPSAFLANRFIEWGIDERRIRVIENPLRTNIGGANPPTRLPEEDSRTARLAYFGQYTPFKGIDTLLDAVASLRPRIRKRLSLSLFGLGLRRQPEQIRQRLTAKIEALKDCVVNYGPYENDSVISLMRSVDWVVVPSTWWENSPVVIQEARSAGVPVLCSNIGGMSEKVRPGLDGTHFLVGSSADLADKISAIVDGRLAVTPGPATDYLAEVAEIVECYRQAIAEDRNAAAPALAQ
jgi:glycosyltransferase involved in cell wall biosynthesis